MTRSQWEAFTAFRNEYKKLCTSLMEFSEIMIPLQKEAALKDTPEYPLENPVVYNTLYDEITEADEIKIIVIGDNPGKEEQLEKNRKYLVGQSGRIAEGFFARNGELGIDFRKNALIFNKTPIHTAKTNHLKHLAENPVLKEKIDSSQKKCAELISDLHKKLCCEMWLVGYSELKRNGIFALFRETLKSCCRGDGAWEKIFVFQHFSMNRFLIDLKSFQKKNPDISLVEQIHGVGMFHRNEIFEI